MFQTPSGDQPRQTLRDSNGLGHRWQSDQSQTVGYDVIAPIGKVEVKSRVLGTDGPFPRVSLKPNKLDADYVMAVRWTPDCLLHAAYLLPAASVRPLFAERLQAKGSLAHIAWQKWIDAPLVANFTEKFARVLASPPATVSAS